MGDRFHITLHRRPEGNVQGRSTEFRGGIYHCLLVDPASLTRPLSTTFDEVFQRLVRLPRMLIEPDGSFVWSSALPEEPWQLDGELFDSGRQLQYVELRGICSGDAFERLVEIIRGDSEALIVQLVREGLFLDPHEFRRMFEF